MVKARGRVYSPIKTVWLATCIVTLVALGLVFRNLQAMWASAAAAMAAPKKGRLAGGEIFWEAWHTARTLEDTTGGRSPGSVHHP